MTASILTCTDAAYHDDPCSTPSLSASTAHTLLSRSPFHAWLEHPKLGGKERKRTAAMATGTLIHSLVLGVPNGEIVAVDAPDWRTKAARESRDAALAAGQIPVLVEDRMRAEIASLRIREGLARKGIVLDGESEIKLAWHEGDVQCRGMIDHARGPVLYDLKTIDSADLDTIAKHMTVYGYDVQRAAYESAWTALHPEHVGAIDFVFLFVEVEDPWCVTPVRVDGMRRMLGDMKWQRAVRTWAECLRTNTWPDYSTGIATLGAKPWEIDAEMGKEVTV